jgi:hypothetical protein
VLVDDGGKTYRDLDDFLATNNTVTSVLGGAVLLGALASWLALRRVVPRMGRNRRLRGDFQGSSGAAPPGSHVTSMV